MMRKNLQTLVNRKLKINFFNNLSTSKHSSVKSNKNEKIDFKENIVLKTWIVACGVQIRLRFRCLLMISSKTNREEFNDANFIKMWLQNVLKIEVLLLKKLSAFL